MFGTNEDYKRVQQRNKWVAFLKQNRKKNNYSDAERQHIMAWASKTTIHYDKLYEQTRSYVSNKYSEDAVQKLSHQALP